jgi:hypothetical protein
MPIQYVNRKGQTYYLHQGLTKTGKPKYFFSMKQEGQLVETIPDGFEIYENPNAQLFLRKIQPKLITDDEVAAVEEGMKHYSQVEYYRVDVRKNIITIFITDQDLDRLTEFFRFAPGARGINLKDYFAKTATYSPMLRFVLLDKDRRIFSTQRYCFLGSIDDWIDIGRSGKLNDLVKTYVKHLGQESYYDLF